MQPAPKAHLMDIYRGVATSHSRDGFLRLDLNESVDGLPGWLVRKACDAIGPETLATYPEYDRLTDRLAEREGLRADQVLLTNGSDAGIKYLFDAYVGKGDTVLHTDPTFAMYPVWASIAQAKAQPVPYTLDLDFPYDDFLDAIGPEVKMAVVVNPNNPTGSFLEQDRLASLANAASKHGTLFVVDEAYHHYLKQTSLGLVDELDNTVVLRTFSKLFGLAGLRLGCAHAPAPIIQAMRRVKPTFDVGGLAVHLGHLLLDHPEVMEGLQDTVEEGRTVLRQELDREGIAYRDGKGNFLLINCGRHSVDIADGLKEDGILVAAGFKQPCMNGYLRVTLGGPKHMTRFAAAFIKLYRRTL